MKGVDPEVDQIRKLVSQRLRAQVPGAHPEPDLLTALVENALPQSERSCLLDHLAACTQCRKVFYLSMPDAAEARRLLSLAPRPRPRFAAGWGTLMASLAIVALVVFSAHEQRMNPPARMALKSQPGAVYSPIAEEKAPAEVAEIRQGGRRQEPSKIAASKRPELKHMTAKPQTAMEFDELSGQVRLQRPPEAQPVLSQFGPGLAGQPKDASAANAGDAKRVGDRRKVETSSAQVPVATRVDQSPDAESVMAEASAPTLSVQTVAGKDVNVVSAARVIAPASQFQWTLSPEGAVERSVDAGKTWQKLRVPGGTGFRALAAVGAHVWAGGAKGVLFHSVDSGATWVRVQPSADGRTLDQDIARIDFSDLTNGTVSTAAGAVWKTSDGGESWRSQ